MFTDMWGLSDVVMKTIQENSTLYPSTAYDIIVDLTVHNLHNTSYPGGTASFSLFLVLADASSLESGKFLVVGMHYFWNF